MKVAFEPYTFEHMKVEGPILTFVSMDFLMEFTRTYKKHGDFGE